MTDEQWVIHKHVFEDIGVDGYYETRLPFGARILSVDVQRGNICMWYKWDLAAKNDEPERRAFIIIGTGWEVDYDKFHMINFLGTIQLLDGNLVYHIFEVK